MAVQTRNDSNTKPFIFHSGPASVIQNATIAKDAGRSIPLAPLTLLGEIKSIIGAVVDGTNTGNGTVTVPTLATGGPAMVGLYALEVITAPVTHGGTFQLSDPNGVVLDSNIQMTDAAGSVLVYSGHGIGFTITDGTTNFIVGDDFTVEVTVGAGYLPLEVDETNGLGKVAGVYLGPSILAATIVAALVADNQVLTGDAFIDSDQLVLENSVALTDVIQSGLTVEEELNHLGIRPTSSVDFSAIENT